MNEIKSRKCRICERPFFYNTCKQKRVSYKTRLRRGKNAVTCSRRCSRILTNIINIERSGFIAKILVREKKIKQLENLLRKNRIKYKRSLIVYNKENW